MALVFLPVIIKYLWARPRWAASAGCLLVWMVLRVVLIGTAHRWVLVMLLTWWTVLERFRSILWF